MAPIRHPRVSRGLSSPLPLRTGPRCRGHQWEQMADFRGATRTHRGAAADRGLPRRSSRPHRPGHRAEAEQQQRASTRNGRRGRVDSGSSRGATTTGFRSAVVSEVAGSLSRQRLVMSNDMSRGCTRHCVGDAYRRADAVDDVIAPCGSLIGTARDQAVGASRRAMSSSWTGAPLGGARLVTSRDRGSDCS